MRHRDTQRSRVYKWEDRFLPTYDRTDIPFEQTQTLVDGIWTDLGLKYPPTVIKKKNTHKTAAKANRTHIFVPDTIRGWVLLHELSHSLTLDVEREDTEGAHGPRFVGIYAKLLIRYLRVSEEFLYMSLSAARINFDKNAKPVFCDIDTV